MKILFDTNILLDVFLKREPFFEPSVQAVALAEQGGVEGWICSTTVTTIYYLLAKALSSDEAKKHTHNVLKICNVANVNRVVLEDALTSNFIDYEDAVLYQSAIHANLSGILTRNKKDFQESELPVYNPGQFLNALDILR